MAKLSFLEVVCAVLFTSFVLWQETAAISLSPQISTLPPSTTFSPKAAVCDGFNCPVGRKCAVDENHRPVCVCIDECLTIDIVCGTDGRTYGNECQLQKEACPTDKGIRVAYKGFCLEGSVCYGHQCPPDKQCNVDENNRPVCVCNQVCLSDYNPVCGSDGVTYINLCWLKREACTKGTNLTMARTGPCVYDEYCNGVVCPSPMSCVVDVKNQTSCVCKDCGDYYEPVCGSDYKTYDSECHMEIVACKTNTSITRRSFGVCSEGPNCQGIVCPTGKHCDSQHQPEPKCVCNAVCPTTYSPVCGTNNKTYNNPCELKRDACVTDTLIRAWFDRRCEEGPICSDNYNCLDGRTCALDERNQPICVCYQFCNPKVKEVCGTDYKTYTNECFLNIAACLTNKRIRVQRYGQCEEATVCDGFSCPKGRRCAVNERQQPVCVCLERCPNTTDIVCGSDGRTYGNECELQKEACTSNTNTQVAYKGYCLEGSVCNGYRCPSDRECNVNQYNQPACVCNTTCPSDYNPVCGSDGANYNNLCQLEREACTTGTNITVARIGQCVYDEYCNGVVCPYPKTCVVDAENQTSCSCNYKCRDYYYPVCGSDNKTYDNQCHMDRVACQTNISITSNYNGVCSEGSNCEGIDCPDGTHCDSQHQQEPKCVCDTVCPKTYSPFCGSNNKTYNNSCELKRDSCLTNTSITVWYDRRCEEGPRCRYTHCPYGRTCAMDERNQPMCVCSLYCYAGPTEVCGSDNKTYSSECLLTAAACLTNKTISVQRNGKCKGEASTATTATTPIAGHP